MRTLLFTAGVLLAGATPAHAAVTLSSGHVDYGARIVGGKLQAQIKDGTRQGRATWRDPAGVVIAVDARARHTLPENTFLGKRGTRLWMIPQTQKAGVVWLGWNTQELKAGDLRGGLTWTLERVSGPGRMTVFTTGAFGDASVKFDSARSRPGTLNVPANVHAHANWSFARAGTYKLRFKSTVTARSGKRLSDTATLTVRVR
jgi:putative ABC transporter-associated repeat protein